MVPGSSSGATLKAAEESSDESTIISSQTSTLTRNFGPEAMAAHAGGFHGYGGGLEGLEDDDDDDDVSSDEDDGEAQFEVRLCTHGRELRELKLAKLRKANK